MIELRKRIEVQWTGCKKEKGRIEVYFEMDSSGNLIEIRLVKGTSDIFADETTLNAIKSVFPYQVPPQTSKASLKIKAIFDCSPKSKPQDFIANRDQGYELSQGAYSDQSENYANQSDQAVGDYPPLEQESSNFPQQQFYPHNQYAPSALNLPQYNYDQNTQRQFLNQQPFYPAPSAQKSSNYNQNPVTQPRYSDRNSQADGTKSNYEQELPQTHLFSDYQSPQNNFLPTEDVEIKDQIVDSKYAKQDSDSEPDSNNTEQSSFFDSMPPSISKIKETVTATTVGNETSLASRLDNRKQDNLWLIPLTASLAIFVLGFLNKKKPNQFSAASTSIDEELIAKVDSIESEIEELSPKASSENFDFDAFFRLPPSEFSFDSTFTEEQELEFEREGFLKEPFIAFLERESVRIVKEYEQSQGRTVKDVSQENVGYDLISSSEHEERHIEVKGKARQGTILITPNEWRTAQVELDLYYLYIVENLLSKSRTLKIIQNPYTHMKPDSSRYLYVLQRSKYDRTSESIQTKSFMKGVV